MTVPRLLDDAVNIFFVTNTIAGYVIIQGSSTTDINTITLVVADLIAIFDGRSTNPGSVYLAYRNTSRLMNRTCVTEEHETDNCCIIGSDHDGICTD